MKSPKPLAFSGNSVFIAFLFSDRKSHPLPRCGCFVGKQKLLHRLFGSFLTGYALVWLQDVMNFSRVAEIAAMAFDTFGSLSVFFSMFFTA